jgi:hypothetical protein
MNLKLNDVVVLCKKIIEKAERNGIKDIQTDKDYYWDISSDDMFRFKEKDKEIIVGSLIDDWNSLKKILKESDDPSILDFDRLANVIKAVGYLINKSKNVY